MARFKCFTNLLTYIHYCGPERKEITQSMRRDWLTDRWRGIAACRAGTTASWWTATTTHQRPSDSPSRRRRRSVFCSQQSSTHSHTHTHTPAKYDKVGTGRGFDMRAMTAWHVIARNHAVLSATHTWNGPCQGQMRILSVQDWLRGFSGLFTDTSEHIHFYFLVLLFPLFCCWFRAVE